MKNNYIEALAGKVYVHIRDNTKKSIWQYYFSHAGTPYRGTTGHTDINEAKMEAIHQYKMVRDGKQVVETKRTSFKVVAERWLKINETHRDIANKRKAVEKFFIPFFHDVLGLKDIGGIRQSHLNDYLVWRRNYYVTGPGSAKAKKHYRRGDKKVAAKAQAYGIPKDVTLNRENQNLNLILTFAKKEGFISSTNLVKMDTLKNDGDRRPTFTTEQCDTLVKTAKCRIDAGHTDKIRYERQSLYDFVVLLRHTGLRPHEALALKWGDIDFAGNRLTVRKGKTGYRVMPVPFPELMTHLKGMMAARTKEGIEPSATEHLFIKQDGKPVGSFKTSFEGLVKACGFVAAGSKEFSLYSFRHHMLTYLPGLGVPEPLVVRILGTSRRMMDVHYDHTSADAVLRWFDDRRKQQPTQAIEGSVGNGLNLQSDTTGTRLVLGKDGLEVQR